MHGQNYHTGHTIGIVIHSGSLGDVKHLIRINDARLVSNNDLITLLKHM